MKTKTRIRIVIAFFVVIICLDIYTYFLSDWTYVFSLGLLVETVFYAIFVFSIVGRKLKRAEWIYYNWWSLQILPLLFAFIYFIYLISNKQYLAGLSLSFTVGLVVGLPVILFRIGLRGLEEIFELEGLENENIKEEQQNK